MSSEKPKRKTEKELYDEVKDVLKIAFANYVEEKPFQCAPFERKENPYLETTAYGHFTETLRREFSDKALRFLRLETNLPDIMGFVQRKPSSKKEIIAVEVKRIPIRFFHILKAQFYQDIFNAKFGLLISPKGIIDDKVRFVLDTPIGRSIRGKVIIAKLKKEPLGYEGKTFWTLQINPKFEDSIPEPFKRFCK